MRNRLMVASMFAGALALAACGNSSNKKPPKDTGNNNEFTIQLDGNGGNDITVDGGGGNGDLTVDGPVGPVAGFGDKCDQSSPCPSGLTCLTGQGAQAGFCSKPCTNSGQQCPGAPTGTAAFCVAQVQTSSGTQTFCAFICKASGQQFNCPSTLQCSSTDNPPGSGQFGCEP